MTPIDLKKLSGGIAVTEVRMGDFLCDLFRHGVAYGNDRLRMPSHKSHGLTKEDGEEVLEIWKRMSSESDALRIQLVNLANAASILFSFTRDYDGPLTMANALLKTELDSTNKLLSSFAEKGQS